jgi:hypothetical protein
MPSPRFLARSFMALFGTPREIVGIIKNAGVTPPAKNTVEKWGERGVLPMKWFMVLALVLKKRGQPVSVYDFIDVPAPKTLPKTRKPRKQ